jgi:hypothetical protein
VDLIHPVPLLTAQEADHIAEGLPDQFPEAAPLVHLPVPRHQAVRRQVLHPAAEEGSFKLNITLNFNSF